MAGVGQEYAQVVSLYDRPSEPQGHHHHSRSSPRGSPLAGDVELDCLAALDTKSIAAKNVCSVSTTGTRQCQRYSHLTHGRFRVAGDPAHIV